MKRNTTQSDLRKGLVMSFSKLLLVGIFLISQLGAFAQQERTITGKVGGENMAPIPGATVVVKGTTIGTVTDVEGNYSLSIPVDSRVLVFSYIGMKTEEVTIGNQTNIDVQLYPDVVGLDEVVVIGYGTQQRRDLTGSVSSMSTEDVTAMPVSRLDEALQGSIPGLDVVSSGQNPGDGSQILLRGRRSFSASNAPLLILDGIPFYGDIKDINPYDIASIDVLKDASSTAIYGSRGANGVIIITTKRGGISKPKLSIDSFYGPTMIYGRLPYGTGDQYAERGREAYRAAGDYPDDGQPHPELDEQFFQPEEWENMQKGTWTDYQDLLFQTGYKQKHQVGVDGGTAALNTTLPATCTMRKESYLAGFSIVTVSEAIWM
ncbi:MAG: TonB-dependent receptor plug domain-containing protein [Bacteroidota bacterium]